MTAPSTQDQFTPRCLACSSHNTTVERGDAFRASRIVCRDCQAWRFKPADRPRRQGGRA
jgi:hypothetical protein